MTGLDHTIIISNHRFKFPNEANQSIANSIHHLNDIQVMLEKVNNFGCCIQAGANMGVYPYILSQYFDEVHSFEPDPISFQYAKENLKDCHNIILHNCALGQENKKMDMARKIDNCGANYLIEGDKIEVKPIDSLNLKNVGLIQLDIEGYEFFAIMGALETIKNNYPVVVVEDKGLGEKYKIEQFSVERLLKDKFSYKLHKKITRDYIYVR